MDRVIDNIIDAYETYSIIFSELIILLERINAT